MLPTHLARYVVQPALAHVGNGTRGFETVAAIWLVVGTMAVESEFRAIDQHVGSGDRTFGPAFGLAQIEEATAEDIWGAWLAYRPDWRARVQSLLAPVPSRTAQLATNLAYGSAMCRLIYWRQQDCTLPARPDPRAYAALWKRFYNTGRGAGTEAKFLDTWQRLVAPHFTEDL